MIDMGQADRTLRLRPISTQHRMCWTIALKKAAQNMGFQGYMDVPEEEEESMKTQARQIQSGNS